MLTPEAFDFVLNNELKRAVRSTELHAPGGRADARDPEHVPQPRHAPRSGRLVSREVRETDLPRRRPRGNCRWSCSTPT